jgi:hypothetical protein
MATIAATAVLPVPAPAPSVSSTQTQAQTQVQAQVVTPPRAASQSSGAHTAWRILSDPDSPKDAAALQTLLSELGVTREEDLIFLSPTDHVRVQACLKSAKGNAFSSTVGSELRAYGLAWSIICDPLNAEGDGTQLQAVMTDLGLREQADLSFLDEGDIRLVSGLLRKVKRNAFLAYLAR